MDNLLFNGKQSSRERESDPELHDSVVFYVHEQFNVIKVKSSVTIREDRGHT